MFALITEVVASAASLGGGSRRDVGVLLSLRSLEPRRDGWMLELLLTVSFSQTGGKTLSCLL